MTRLGGGGRVFISHSADDEAIANEICAAIEARGVRCWIAPRDIRVGDDFLASIRAAVDAASAFVLVLSRTSIESPYVFSETEAAFSAKRPIFPIRIERVTPDHSMKLLISRYHRVDAIGAGREAGIRRLAEAVARRVAAGIGGREVGPRRPDDAPPEPAATRSGWRAAAAGPYWLAAGPGAAAAGAALCGLLALALLGGAAGGLAAAGGLVLAGWIVLGAIAGRSVKPPADSASRLAYSGLATLLVLLVALAGARWMLAETNPSPDAPVNLAGPESGGGAASAPPAGRVDTEALANEQDNRLRQLASDEANAAALNAQAAQQNQIVEPVSNTTAVAPANTTGM